MINLILVFLVLICGINGALYFPSNRPYGAGYSGLGLIILIVLILNITGVIHFAN
jgi:hypothetical protein